MINSVNFSLKEKKCDFFIEKSILKNSKMDNFKMSNFFFYRNTFSEIFVRNKNMELQHNALILKNSSKKLLLTFFSVFFPAFFSLVKIYEE